MADSAPSQPLVSVVIPNLNGDRWLPRCLQSLRAGTHSRLEIIVADDGSTDHSAAITAEHEARFVPGMGEPTGFAKTANRGIRTATGEWVFLLNNDTEVHAEAIAAMLTTAAETRADVVTPLVVSMRNPDRIDSAGLLVFRDGTGRPWLHNEPRRMAPNTHTEILLPIGAAMLISRRALDHVGLLDESFGSYAEDLEWGLRAARAGVRTVLQPGAEVLHWFSGTAGTLSPYKARCIERNHVSVAIRHLPMTDVLLLPIWTLARWVALRAMALKNPTDGPADSGAITRAALHGAWEGARRIPRAVRERRELARRFPVDARAWRRRLSTGRCRLADFRHFGA